MRTQQLLATVAIVTALQLLSICSGSVLSKGALDAGVFVDLGTIENKTFHFYTTTMGWGAAKTHCESFGMRLATITSDAQQEFLTTSNNFIGFPTQFYWTAGRDSRTIDQFAWEGSDAPLGSHGQGWYFSAHQTCVAFYSHANSPSNGNWYSYPCISLHRVLCETV